MLGDCNQPEEHRLTQEVLTPCRDFTKRRAYQRLRAINTRGGAKIETRDTKENVTSQDRQATFENPCKIQSESYRDLELACLGV